MKRRRQQIALLLAQLRWGRFAHVAEAQAPGEAHEIEYNINPIWQAREDVHAQATKLFFEAVERIRSTGR